MSNLDVIFPLSLTHFPAFYVTELLLFRPFVLLCLELKRRGIKDILSERNGQVEMVVLFEAAKRSVKSAKDMIRFCDSLFSLQLGIQVFSPEGSCGLILTLAGPVFSRLLLGKCMLDACAGYRTRQRSAL